MIQQLKALVNPKKTLTKKIKLNDKTWNVYKGYSLGEVEYFFEEEREPNIHLIEKAHIEGERNNLNIN